MEQLPHIGGEENQGRVISIDGAVSIFPERKGLWQKRWFRIAIRIGIASLILTYPAQRLLDYEVARESSVAVDASAKELGKKAAEQGFDTLKQEWTKYFNGPEFQKLKNGQLSETQAEAVQKTVDAFYDFEKRVNYDANGDSFIGKPPEEHSQPPTTEPAQPVTDHRFSYR